VISISNIGVFWAEHRCMLKGKLADLPPRWPWRCDDFAALAVLTVSRAMELRQGRPHLALAALGNAVI
jgi:hypothetical protein